MKTIKPSVNLLGIFTLGFHNQHDCRELKRLCHDLGIEVNVVLPEGSSIDDIKRLPRAWANIVPYREIGLMAAEYLQSTWDMPYVSTAPIGLIDTATFIRSLCAVLTRHGPGEHVLDPAGTRHGRAMDTAWPRHGPAAQPTRGAADAPVPHVLHLRRSRVAVHAGSRRSEDMFSHIEKYIHNQTHFISQAAWFSRSIDCQNLTGKKAFIFGDGTHAAAMAKILSREMGLRVVCAGTYCTHDSDWFREHVSPLCDEVLITDDHRVVAEAISRLEPAAIFGTQMERHIGKRLGIPCGVISSPAHVQNFPLGYRPFVGFEGSNQIADLVYNSFTLGMEDHLLEVFGGHDRAAHGALGQDDQTPAELGGDAGLGRDAPWTASDAVVRRSGAIVWTEDGLKELQKIPGFVRGRVKKNTEAYAQENNINSITIDILYEAKEALTSAP